MARMVPDLPNEGLSRIESAAERMVYQRLRDDLDDQVLVLHGVEWIVRTPTGDVKDGEADFLICDPNTGMLVVEVKGGGIAYDGASDSWFSVDRYKQRHAIKDPFRQAKQAKYSVLGKLRETPEWPFARQHVLAGHAVLLPDVDDVMKLCMPHSPRDIIGGADVLADVKGWITRVFKFWQGQEREEVPLGLPGVRAIERVFARSAEVLPLLASRLAEEERVRISLTEQQARILDTLGRRRRAAIAGGAGTGKTLIAVEKSRRLVREGFRTLLVCYNRPLADRLSAICSSIEGLSVASFHQLCGEWIARADSASGRNLKQEALASYPTANEWDVHLPAALSYAVDILPERYDAVVVDEGQDFREEYWFPIELLLAHQETSPLYVFYDQNQDLYHRASTFPIHDEPFVLTVNCRNTQHIHQIAYQFFRGEPTDPPVTEGAAVQFICAGTTGGQLHKTHNTIVHLLTQQQVKPDDACVLLADTSEKAFLAQLERLPLPGRGNWSRDPNARHGMVLLETVNRFKGLESPIVFLCGLDRLSPDQHREVFYVGLSRAKSMLYVTATDQTCQQLRAPTCVSKQEDEK